MLAERGGWCGGGVGVPRGGVEAAVKVGGVAVSTARSSVALGPGRGNIRGSTRGVIIYILPRRRAVIPTLVTSLSPAAHTVSLLMDPAHNNRDRPDVPPPRFAEARSLDASPCAASRAAWSLTGKRAWDPQKNRKKSNAKKAKNQTNPFDCVERWALARGA